MNHLEKIIQRTEQRVETLKSTFSRENLQSNGKEYKKRKFVEILNKSSEELRNSVVAEIKKASPSKGIIREDFDPVWTAKQYEKGGAACLSILTEPDFFLGSLDYLLEVRKICHLPILRKDFIIDEIQILESKAFGADCILLIASILDKNKIKDFYQIAKENELDVLIEVHDEKEAEIAMAVSPELLGINNRDLKTFDVDINNSIKIKKMLPKSQLIISESGIYSRDDINDLNEAKIYNFLVGEFFMRKKEPYKAVQDLIALSPISSR